MDADLLVFLPRHPHGDWGLRSWHVQRVKHTPLDHGREYQRSRHTGFLGTERKVVGSSRRTSGQVLEPLFRKESNMPSVWQHSLYHAESQKAGPPAGKLRWEGQDQVREQDPNSAGCGWLPEPLPHKRASQALSGCIL